ncbi:DUF2470 domain-containing protein [Formicincola oecophyllae]|uniref:DUF2470 domain-containing protein n=1 Tax=Formicincola oecophyllae TaxID=2558361 RepID=A0A4Y6U9L1_9PROT|nr:DUF2470 domain-containing protein [Formicincola oecophyllae]QDH14072.1 DUF2470 domain-containing protein [Formicincola oecophyllae]
MALGFYTGLLIGGGLVSLYHHGDRLKRYLRRFTGLDIVLFVAATLTGIMTVLSTAENFGFTLPWPQPQQDISSQSASWAGAFATVLVAMAAQAWSEKNRKKEDKDIKIEECTEIIKSLESVKEIDGNFYISEPDFLELENSAI